MIAYIFEVLNFPSVYCGDFAFCGLSALCDCPCRVASIGGYSYALYIFQKSRMCTVSVHIEVRWNISVFWPVSMYHCVHISTHQLTTWRGKESPHPAAVRSIHRVYVPSPPVLDSGPDCRCYVTMYHFRSRAASRRCPPFCPIRRAQTPEPANNESAD